MYTVLRGGCHARHPQGFFLSREEGIDHYVLLLVHTPGEFYIDGVHTSALPGQGILFAPYTPYRYESPQGSYMDDWLHFSISSSAQKKDESLRLPPCNTFFPVPHMEVCTLLLKQLLWEASYTSDTALCKANTDALFSVLWNHLCCDSLSPAAEKQTPYAPDLRLIRLEMQSAPQETHLISGYAKRLHISTSYFEHLYRDLFSVSFQQDLISFRIETAKELLRASSLPVSQILLQCGYQTEVHFFRQFKAITGMTPGEYRRSCR